MAQSGLISQVKPGVSDNLNNLSSQCTRLYIQNLPAYLETNRLREHFASKGEVTDAIVVKTKDGSKSRRFGFIGYKTHEQAKIAKEFFHQSFLDTCKINVQYAVAVSF
jgi:multiple RNA-binding domain-containing protein 1